MGRIENLIWGILASVLAVPVAAFIWQASSKVPEPVPPAPPPEKAEIYAPQGVELRL